jgi:RNA polymerase sigma-70 factor (ECF subfamily)
MASARAIIGAGTGTGIVAADQRSGTLDEPSFVAVYRSLARPLWAYLYRMLGDGSAADDGLQEVFMRYAQAPLSTDDPAQVRAYLYRIASNLAIDHLRRRQREERVVAPEPPSEAIAAAGTTERDVVRRQDMARTFRKLNPKHRALLWLAYVEGSSHEEIAASLGLARRSVPVLLFRARRTLAGLLKGKGWEG